MKNLLSKILILCILIDIILTVYYRNNSDTSKYIAPQYNTIIDTLFDNNDTIVYKYTTLVLGEMALFVWCPCSNHLGIRVNNDDDYFEMNCACNRRYSFNYGKLVVK